MMTTYDYNLSDPRSIARYKCARVAELVLTRKAPVLYFDKVLEECAQIFAVSASSFPPRRLN